MAHHLPPHPAPPTPPQQHNAVSRLPPLSRPIAAWAPCTRRCTPNKNSTACMPKPRQCHRASAVPMTMMARTMAVMGALPTATSTDNTSSPHGLVGDNGGGETLDCWDWSRHLWWRSHNIPSCHHRCHPPVNISPLSSPTPLPRPPLSPTFSPSGLATTMTSLHPSTLPPLMAVNVVAMTSLQQQIAVMARPQSAAYICWYSRPWTTAMTTTMMHPIPSISACRPWWHMSLAGNVSVVSGIFFSKRQTRQHVAWHVGANTDHASDIEPYQLLRCRVNVALAWQLPDISAHVGKNNTNSTTILCNNQIIMAMQRWLWEMVAARWHMGRHVGRPLKVAAALGRGGSGWRWATRVSTATLCNERGGRRTGTSNSTLNYFKQNASMKTLCYGMPGVMRCARGCDATARRDETRRDDDKMRGMTRDETQCIVAWQCDGIGCDDKGQRDDAATNQQNKQMNEWTNKQSGHDVRWPRGKRWRLDARGRRRRMIFLSLFVGGGGYLIQFTSVCCIISELHYFRMMS